MGKLAKPTSRDTLTRVESPSNARDVAERSKARGGGGPEPDELYAVVSALCHALRGAAACDRYIGDAQAAGDAELERFFRACRTAEHARAARAKRLLLARLEDRFLDDPDLDPDGPERAP
jgi:hypothetical protein